MSLNIIVKLIVTVSSTCMQSLRASQNIIMTDSCHSYMYLLQSQSPGLTLFRCPLTSRRFLIFVCSVSIYAVSIESSAQKKLCVCNLFGEVSVNSLDWCVLPTSWSMWSLWSFHACSDLYSPTSHFTVSLARMEHLEINHTFDTQTYGYEELSPFCKADLRLKTFSFIVRKNNVKRFFRNRKGEELSAGLHLWPGKCKQDPEIQYSTPTKKQGIYRI